MTDQQIAVGPLVTPELLRALRQVYPLRRPAPDWSDRDIWIEVGQQTVLEFLEAQYEESVSQQLGG